jgi:hypothetical protein
MQLRERLEIRRLAHERYDAHAGQVYALQRLADRHGVDDVLDWLRAGVPTCRKGRPPFPTNRSASPRPRPMAVCIHGAIRRRE